MAEVLHATGGAVEVREADGAHAPRLVGLAVPFGRVAGDRAEVFSPGSVEAASPLPIYDRHTTEGGAQVLTYASTEVREDGLHVEAPLTPFVQKALDAGRRSLSVEFRAKRTQWTNGVREVLSAVVEGVALIPSGAYDQAKAEVRSRQTFPWWGV